MEVPDLISHCQRAHRIVDGELEGEEEEEVAILEAMEPGGSPPLAGAGTVRMPPRLRLPLPLPSSGLLPTCSCADLHSSPSLSGLCAVGLVQPPSLASAAQLQDHSFVCPSTLASYLIASLPRSATLVRHPFISIPHPSFTPGSLTFPRTVAQNITVTSIFTSCDPNHVDHHNHHRSNIHHPHRYAARHGKRRRPGLRKDLSDVRPGRIHRRRPNSRRFPPPSQGPRRRSELLEHTSHTNG